MAAAPVRPLELVRHRPVAQHAQLLGRQRRHNAQQRTSLSLPLRSSAPKLTPACSENPFQSAGHRASFLRRIPCSSSGKSLCCALPCSSTRSNLPRLNATVRWVPAPVGRRVASAGQGSAMPGMAPQLCDRSQQLPAQAPSMTDSHQQVRVRSRPVHPRNLTKCDPFPLLGGRVSSS